MRRITAFATLFALCLCSIAAASGGATLAAPPIFLASVIISGSNQGLQLYSPLPRTGTTLTVKPNVNGDTQANGTVSRSPGDSQSAFFRGRFGRKRVSPQPTLPLAEQPRDVSTLSSAISRIHGASAAIKSHHRTPRQALTEGLVELQAGRKDVLSSDRPQELKDQVVADIDTAIRQARAALNQASQTRTPNVRTLRRLITKAVRAAQVPFGRLAEAGLNRGFDVLLQDDTRPGDKLQLNTASGEYVFRCSGRHSGTGTAAATETGFTLTHVNVDRRVQAAINTRTRSGSASLQAPLGTTVCAITDTNYTNDTPPSTP